LQKVLIVDDEHNIRNILDFSLNAEGFEVISATNGEDARERGQEVGAEGYITKPFSPGRLIESVQSLLGVKRK